MLLIAGTLGTAVAAVASPKWSAAAAASRVAAGVSPLWLLAPIILGFFLVWWGNDAGILVAALGMKIPALLMLQLAVATWILYRHRRWPHLVLPLAALCCLWQWGLMMSAVLSGVSALAS